MQDAQSSGISLAKVIQTMLRELFSVRGAKYDTFVVSSPDLLHEWCSQAALRRRHFAAWRQHGS